MVGWLRDEAWTQFLALTDGAPAQGDIGHPLQSFFGFPGIDRQVPGVFTRRRTNRKELALFVADNQNHDLDRFLAISAWGSMNRRHAVRAVNGWSDWGVLFDDTRAADSRQDIYEVFRSACVQDRLPGLGPAYFTKLIMYIRPDLCGYILDQWTGKAVEVLSADGFRLKFDGHRISPRNSARDYEEFCSRMDVLAARSLGIQLGDLTPDQAHDFEGRLFSEGGKGRRAAAPWRSYVRSHWRRPPPEI